MSKGWITIERDIQEHWIFKDAEKLRAWLIVLMQVNHKENKSLIKGKLMTCNRGESLMSHNSWAEKFGKNWNRSKVIRFFKLLETDHMIVQHNEKVTTRLSVCNYTQYQDKSKKSEQANEQQGEQVAVHQANTKRTGDSTQLNNVNNDNKLKEGAKAPAPVKTTRFVKPTLSEAEEYRSSKQLNMKCSDFIDHFDSNGWKVGGKAPMKDWRAAMRQWAKRDFGGNNKKTQGGINW